MKTVFLNPFLPTDLNEKVTSVSFKIGSFDYIAKHANVKTTEIDFDKRIIQINDDLDSTASLRELVRAFFIIVAYELNLNAEFPNGKKAHLDEVEFNNPVISFIDLTSAGQSSGNITLNEFTTKVVPNSEDEGTVLSIIDITPAKLNEIVAKINSARDASTTGDIKIAIYIKTTGTKNNLVILINVI